MTKMKLDELKGEANVEIEAVEEKKNIQIRAIEDSEKICAQPVEVGVCRAMIPRYYYDSEEGCVEFYWGGCGGNENNFRSKKDCEDFCGNHPESRIDGEP